MSFVENNSGRIVYMTSSNIHTVHAFTTRVGGVSTDIYTSLNLGLGSGDSLENVLENYSLLCGALGISADSIVFSAQVHGAHIRVVTKRDACCLYNSTDAKADGLITREAGVSLMVFTGDCVPILLYDPVSSAAGAVHAGWRGTVLDAVGAAVGKMVSEFSCSPENICAAIGPCISQCCFETDNDVADALSNMPGMTDSDLGSVISSSGKKYMIDLKQVNKLLLQRAGVTDISISDECTSCKSDKYWSHRKTKGRRGSQSAIITLP